MMLGLIFLTVSLSIFLTLVLVISVNAHHGPPSPKDVFDLFLGSILLCGTLVLAGLLGFRGVQMVFFQQSDKAPIVEVIGK